MTSFEPKPFGKYFLMEKLAIGGMAEIYKAKTFGVDGFEKQLAIKKILPHCSADKEFIAMLSDEAKLVVRLSHTNIVQIFDLGKVGDDYYISMEFIDGVNLRELLTRGKELNQPVPLPVCLYIASEICKGLDYAHSKRDENSRPLNIVHRDISPQNVLISFEGETKIVDFGIAKAAMNMSQTSAGILKGKVNYMSPEQALGKIVDQQTDIFSAGLVLYELLTGTRLFSGETQFHVLKQIQTTQITVDTLPTNIPEEIRAILAKALAYDVKDRFESAGDFQIALTKVLYSQYVDFSSKQLSSLVQKWFEPELTRRRQISEQPAIIDTKTRLVMDQSMSESIVHREQTDALSNLQLMDTTKPEGDMKFRFRHDADPPSLSVAQMRKPSSNHRWIFGFLAFVVLLASLGAYLVTHTQKQKPQETKSLLTIESLPEGASIFINDEPMDLSTNATIDTFPIDSTLSLRLEKDGFATWEQSVTLTNPEVTVKATLEPTRATPTEENPAASVALKIISTPEDATVSINGKQLDQKTPLTISDFPLGSKVSVLVTLPGYVDYLKELTLDQSSLELAAELIPLEKQIIDNTPPPVLNKESPTVIKKTTLQITSNVEATIYLNGKNMGQSPQLISTEPGKFKLRLEKNGYVSREKKISVKEGEEASVSINLEKEKPIESQEKLPESKTNPTPPIDSNPRPGKAGTGNVRIDSTPRGAAVIFDGKKAGITPIVIPSATWGVSHSITLTLPGYRSWSQSFTLSKSYLEISAPLSKE